MIQAGKDANTHPEASYPFSRAYLIPERHISNETASRAFLAVSLFT